MLIGKTDQVTTVQLNTAFLHAVVCCNFVTWSGTYVYSWTDIDLVLNFCAHIYRLHLSVLFWYRVMFHWLTYSCVVLYIILLLNKLCVYFQHVDLPVFSLHVAVCCLCRCCRCQCRNIKQQLLTNCPPCLLRMGRTHVLSMLGWAEANFGVTRLSWRK